jgi:hypothetical protein
MNSAHSQDVKDLKVQIERIYDLTDMPEKKTLWGVHNPQTASLLRPMGVITGSEEW